MKGESSVVLSYTLKGRTTVSEDADVYLEPGFHGTLQFRVTRARIAVIKRITVWTAHAGYTPDPPEK